MAAEAEIGGLWRICVVSSRGRRLGQGGRWLSRKFCSLCWQTDVADYRSTAEKLRLYSDSIHSSLKARKRPSSEVITQEALAARQTQTEALRCGDGGMAPCECLNNTKNGP